MVGLLEDVAAAFMDTGRHFRALDTLRRADELALPDPLDQETLQQRIRLKLKMARSLVATNQLKAAATKLDEVRGTRRWGHKEATCV